MAVEFDRSAYLSTFDRTLKVKEQACRLGGQLARQGFQNIFLVGCGAPNREMGAIHAARFLLETLQGASIPQAMLRAARSAAECCTYYGAFGYGQAY